jgi:hypothetical protein
MDFLRDLWGAFVTRLLSESLVAIRLGGAFLGVFLMLIGQLAWAWVVMGATIILWLGVHWLAWRRSGAREADVHGGARWGDDFGDAGRAGLRRAEERRRWP